MARKPAKRRTKAAAAPAPPRPRPQTKSEINALYKAAAAKYGTEQSSKLLAAWQADDPGGLREYYFAARHLARKPREATEAETAIVREIGEQSQAEWLDEQTEEAMNAILQRQRDAADLDNDVWSEEKSPKEWRSIFKLSPSTFRRRIKNRQIRVKKITEKRIKIHRDDMPN